MTTPEPGAPRRSSDDARTRSAPALCPFGRLPGRYFGRMVYDPVRVARLSPSVPDHDGRGTAQPSSGSGASLAGTWSVPATSARAPATPADGPDRVRKFRPRGNHPWVESHISTESGGRDPVQLPLPFEELERSFLEEGVPLSDQELDRLLGPPTPVPEFRARYYGADEVDGLIQFDAVRKRSVVCSCGHPRFVHLSRRGKCFQRGCDCLSWKWGGPRRGRCLVRTPAVARRLMLELAKVRFDLYSHLLWWTFTFPGDNAGRWSDPVPDDDREQVRLRELVFLGLQRAGLFEPGMTIWTMEMQELRSRRRLAVGGRPVAHWHGFAELADAGRGLSDRDLSARAWSVVRRILKREGLQVEEHPQGERRSFRIESVTNRTDRAIRRRYVTPYLSKPKYDCEFNAARWRFGAGVPRDERARVAFRDISVSKIARRILRNHTYAAVRARTRRWERDHGASWRRGDPSSQKPPFDYSKVIGSGYGVNLLGGYRAWELAVLGARRLSDPLPLNPRPLAHLAEIERRVARGRWSSRLCRWIGRPPVDGPVQLQLGEGTGQWADACLGWSERTEGLVRFEPCEGLPARSWVIFTPDDMVERGEPDLADLPREKQLEIVRARYARGPRRSGKPGERNAQWAVGESLPLG